MIYFQKVRLILIGSLSSFFLFFIMCSMAAADDYSTPHSFQAGDIISADIMNELFEYIQSSKKTVQEKDLVGTWTCDSYNNIVINGRDWVVAGWAPDSDNLFVKLAASSITFNHNGTNYLLTTSAPNPFVASDSKNLESIVKIIGDTFFFTYDSGGGVMQAPMYSIKKISKTRFKLTVILGGGECPRIMFCDKEGLPPAKPLNLYTTKSGLTISLNWVDNSNDETKFIVIRRDSLEGDYNKIGTKDVNETSYTDTVPEPGDYWYRVKATNAHGESLGSNVVNVTVE